MTRGLAAAAVDTGSFYVRLATEATERLPRVQGGGESKATWQKQRSAARDSALRREVAKTAPKVPARERPEAVQT